jgi:hypothetical protein
MVNFLHPETVSLADLTGRIKSSDLVPSRAALLDGLDQNMVKFSQQGIDSLEELQKTLKNARKMEALAQSTGIDQQYLCCAGRRRVICRNLSS